MFLLAFFGFLRCSQFTSSTIHFDPSRRACISDLSRFSDDTMVFHLKRTKTNQCGPSTPVFFFKVQSPLNPFETLANFFQFHKSQSTTMTDPLFIFKSGQVATRFWFHHHFCHLLWWLVWYFARQLLQALLQNWSCHFSLPYWHSRALHMCHGPLVLPNVPLLHLFRSQRSQICSISSQVIGGFGGVCRCPRAAADSKRIPTRHLKK